MTFKVTAETALGQSIYIVGNQPEIGSWSPTASDSRKCTAAAYPVWSCEITWPTPGVAIEYKFQKIGNGSTLWEEGSNRGYTIPSADAVVEVGAAGAFK